jgi:hypothetical protein
MARLACRYFIRTPYMAAGRGLIALETGGPCLVVALETIEE